MSNKKLVILSGGFDPLHEGHIRLFADAAARFDVVIVGLNSDEWLTRKKGKAFMSFSSRLSILKAIKHIDNVLSFDDSDNTAISLIQKVLEQTENKGYDIYFGNGGDRSNGNYPELEFCNKHGIAVVDDLGGSHKANASSTLLKNWTAQETAERDWGVWRVLSDLDPGTKVKELIVYPGKALSWQKHNQRSEIWFIKSGEATLYTSNNNIIAYKRVLKETQDVTIPVHTWHRVHNNTDKLLHIIEIQYGSLCIEEDIVRMPFEIKEFL